MHYDQALATLAALGPELAPKSRAGMPATPPRKFTLDHIRALLAALGDPQAGFRSVLIAGTNGKGSTAATLAAIAAAAGLRTGLYTSPHLLRVNERIRTTGATPALREIPDADFGRLFGQAYTAAEDLVRRATLPHTPSFFELLTATGFLFFAEQRVQLAILEVGLGGRLDATNVVDPLLSVITDIGLDHTEFLGDTIAEIAREKAGILRPGGTLVTLSQHPEANASIGEVAVALDVRGVDAARYLPLRGFNLPAPPASGASSVSLPAPSQPASPAHPGRRSSGGPPQPGGDVYQPERLTTALNQNEREAPVPFKHVDDPAPAPASSQANPLHANRYSLVVEGEALEVDSPLPGEHQQRNLALAVAAAMELRAHHGFAIPNSAIEGGIRHAAWPGRLEWIAAAPAAAAGAAAGSAAGFAGGSVAGSAAGPAHLRIPLLLDVAHNPAGAWTLRAALAQLPDERPRTLLFSCLADKQIDEMARILFPLFDATAGDPARRHDHIVFAPIANPRAATVDQLLAAAHALDIPAHAAPHLQAALGQAQALTPAGGLLVATGSVYLIGELRALVVAQGNPAG